MYSQNFSIFLSEVYKILIKNVIPSVCKKYVLQDVTENDKVNLFVDTLEGKFVIKRNVVTLAIMVIIKAHEITLNDLSLLNKTKLRIKSMLCKC